MPAITDAEINAHLNNVGFQGGVEDIRRQLAKKGRRLVAKRVDGRIELADIEEPMLKLTVKAERSVAMIRPEKGTLVMNFIPLPAFSQLSDSSKAEVLEYMNSISASGVRLTKNGSAYFLDNYAARYFTIEVDDPGAWSYNGGECSVLDTTYIARVEKE